MEEDFGVARVFVLPSEVEGDWLYQRKRSVPEETDPLSNIFGVLFDFGSSQASASVEVGVRAVFGRINVLSRYLSTVNYFEKRSSPRPERLDLGLVLEARTTVEFFEAEVVHLVNEQNYCICGGFGVTKSLFIATLQGLVWIYLRKGKEFLPGLGDVSLGLQHRFLGAHLPHRLDQLQFGFCDQAVSDLVHWGELSAVMFVHPGLSEPVVFSILKTTPLCC